MGQTATSSDTRRHAVPSEYMSFVTVSSKYIAPRPADAAVGRWTRRPHT